MILTETYFQDFLARNAIPITQWTLKIIEREQCYVLKDPVYCNIFWLDLWYHFLAPQFTLQKQVTSIALQDLTTRVSITEGLKLLQVPASLQNINYYANLKAHSPFMINISSWTVFISSALAFIVIIAVSIIFYRPFLVVA